MNNYLNDQPIEKTSQDLLNREGYAKLLSKSLINLDAKNGFCVGIYGPWGYGKTSLINMVIDELKNNKINECNILQFNPWNFNSKDDLLNQFFSLLIIKFKGSKDKKINSIANAAQNYSSALNCLNIPLLPEAGNLISNLIKNKTINGKDVEGKKKTLTKLLQSQKNKIYIVIDDIDRLSNDEIVNIFKLVNTVAKLPNIVFILAFDKRIVSRALEKIQNCDGEEYLEKIIQLPIELPSIQEEDLWKILFEKLDCILENNKYIKYNQEYWSNIFHTIVSKKIKSVRDINLIINKMNFKLSSIGYDVDFCDLLALTTIECKDTKLYDWIRSNKSMLVGSTERVLSNIGKDEKEIVEENKLSIKSIDENKFEYNKSVISLLFPDCKLNNYSYFKKNDTLKYSRVGNENCFDNYFSLNLKSNAVSVKDLELAVYEMSAEDLSKFILKLDAENKSLSFLRKLDSIKTELPSNRIKELIIALSNIARKMNAKEENIFSFSSSSIAETEIVDLIGLLENEDEKLSIITKIVNDSTFDNIETISYIINSIELAYGRFYGKVNPHGNKIVTLDSLIEIEKIYSNKIKKICDKNNLLYTSRSHYLTLSLIECFDLEFYNEYLSKILTNDLNKIKYLCSFSTEWKGSDSIEWKFSEKDFEKLSKYDMVEIINNCIRDGRIAALSIDDSKRAIAYILLKTNKVSESGMVTDKDVNNFLQSLINEEKK